MLSTEDGDRPHLPLNQMKVLLVSNEMFSEWQTRIAWDNAQRRGSHLIRKDVKVPLSADPRVTVRSNTPDPDSGRIIVTVRDDDQDGMLLSALASIYNAVEVQSTDYAIGATFLGFDVCDQDLYSALTNCGYGNEFDRSKAEATWSDRLNENHLFDKIEFAKCMRHESNVRVPEHAPFFVLRLYRV
jgi:hypothetical protein